MSIPVIVFVAIAIPVLFFMLTWVLTASYSICFPEEPLPFEKDRALLRQQAAMAGGDVPVGVREIREDQHWRRRHAEAVYHYAEGGSIGLPPTWKEDLWYRRN